MKSLYLLRHAKAEADPAHGDFERRLAPRGEAAARAMGRELRRLGLAADHILASPATRVVQTLEGLADGYGGRMAVDYDQSLYLASPETLLGFVRAADESHERLLIAGHNPGLEQLALLLGRGGPLRDEIAVKYPTGALAEISLDVEGWGDVEEGAGALARFIRPRDLDPAPGPELDS